MKKTIPIILVLVCVIGLFAYSVTYRNHKNAELEKQTEIVDKNNTDDNSSNENRVIVDDAVSGYKLFYENGIPVLSYKDSARLDFPSWTESIELMTPEFYYNDFDRDKEDELMIRLVDTYKYDPESELHSYTLYLFNVVEDDAGKTKLEFIVGNISNWNVPFNGPIKSEITQLTNCKKIIQFAMNNATESIEYDSETGITNNKYVGYALADCDDKKHYYTVSKYTRGLGIYSIDDEGQMMLDIQVIVNYEESDLDYYIGNIHCLMIIDKNAFHIRPNTITFVPLDERRVADPRVTADKEWSYTVNNLSSSYGDSKVISTIDNQIALSNSSSSSLYFGNLNSDVRNVDKIEVTESCIIFTAKSGFSFDEEQLKNGKFSVINMKDRLDISYDAEIKGNTLKINFDKTYNKEDISELSVNFGI